MHGPSSIVRLSTSPAGRIGIAVAAAVMAASPAMARDYDFFGSIFAPHPRYYAPRGDDQRSDDSPYVDRLKSLTAEQLKRAPKPPPAKGPLLIIVSLAKQRLTLYDDGVAIAHSPVSSGTASRPTPAGVFAVIEKQRWHRSNLYSDAPMPFMQRITWSGVALHSGVLPGYPASHGCIRMPNDFAIRLWQTTKVGARVIVTHGEVTPVDISNPKLFQPKPPEPPPAEATLQPAISVATDKADTTAAIGAAKPDAESPAADAKPAAPDTKVASADALPSKPETRPAIDMPLRPGPVSVFISRKERRLYVRKGFAPVFDTAVTIQDPDKPLGTHVFTALHPTDGGSGVRWMVVTVPQPDKDKAEVRKQAHAARRGHRDSEPGPAPASPKAASEALDRITIPDDAAQRIAALTTVGASLIISDQGLGPETGTETDFVVLTDARKPLKKERPKPPPSRYRDDDDDDDGAAYPYQYQWNYLRRSF